MLFWWMLHIQHVMTFAHQDQSAHHSEDGAQKNRRSHRQKQFPRKFLMGTPTQASLPCSTPCCWTYQRVNQPKLYSPYNLIQFNTKKIFGRYLTRKSHEVCCWNKSRGLKGWLRAAWHKHHRVCRSTKAVQKSAPTITIIGEQALSCPWQRLGHAEVTSFTQHRMLRVLQRRTKA